MKGKLICGIFKQISVNYDSQPHTITDLDAVILTFNVKVGMCPTISSQAKVLLI